MYSISYFLDVSAICSAHHLDRDLTQLYPPEGLFTRFYFCKIRNSYNIPTRQWDSNPQLPILFIGIKAFSRNRTYIHPHDKSMGYLPLNYKGVNLELELYGDLTSTRFSIITSPKPIPIRGVIIYTVSFLWRLLLTIQSFRRPTTRGVDTVLSA